MTVWCNAALSSDALEILKKDLSGRLLMSNQETSNLNAAGADPLLAEANIAFGQPDPRQVIDSPNIKWVHLSSAGYTRYDTDEFRAAMRARNGTMTNSSSVYAQPCAEHALAMVLAFARQLPLALEDQRSSRQWNYVPLRQKSFLLSGQSMLIYGYGSIAEILVRLMEPFNLRITGVRRKVRGNEGIGMVTPDEADALLPGVDHVMNILPASPSTDGFFDARRFSLMSPRALFYNIGRGSTVDQGAMAEALVANKIAGAYLDVTAPEPLPPTDRLWALPNCWITPHTAGGHHDEYLRLARHFRENLRRFQLGAEMQDRIM